METIHADSDMIISAKLDNDKAQMYRYSITREITAAERRLLVEALQAILDEVKALTPDFTFPSRS